MSEWASIRKSLDCQASMLVSLKAAYRRERRTAVEPDSELQAILFTISGLGSIA